MAVKTRQEVANEYLLALKGLKPELNVDQVDSDWWIRGQVVGSVVSGVYADQRLIANDAFPQRARRAAIANWLEAYLNRGFLEATKAVGFMSVTGDPGQVVAAGLQAVYSPNGNSYTSTEEVTLDLIAATGAIPMESVGTGQAQNLNDGAELNIPSAPIGLNSSAIVFGGFSDGRDPESDSEARTAILERIRLSLSTGRETDYVQYAKEADPSVVSASVKKFPFGPGTVAVYITSGTTDIDTAIDEGQDISVVPSDQLVETVQEFLDVNKVLTDVLYVLKPVAVEIDVTAAVRYKQGTDDTILSGQTLTQKELVEREIRRAIYKTPVGGRQFGATGFVVASEIEETIDLALSGENVAAGENPILLDRSVFDLSATGVNRMILANEVPIPGTITITGF